MHHFHPFVSASEGKSEAQPREIVGVKIMGCMELQSSQRLLTLLYIQNRKVYNCTRLTGATLLACGKTSQEAFEKPVNILHEFSGTTDRSNVTSILRKGSFGGKLGYIAGLLPGFFLFRIVAPSLRRVGFNEGIGEFKPLYCSPQGANICMSRVPVRSISVNQCRRKGSHNHQRES